MREKTMIGQSRLAGSSKIVMAPTVLPTTTRSPWPAQAQPRRSTGSQSRVRPASYAQVSHPDSDNVRSVSDETLELVILKGSSAEDILVQVAATTIRNVQHT
jgi:hypothetical protein